MKFKLGGNQYLHLDDTFYWVDGCSGCGHEKPDWKPTHHKRPEPVNGVIDWSTEHLLDLASYAELRADALGGPGNHDSYTRSEIKSMRALAARIRKTVAKAEGK